MTVSFLDHSTRIRAVEAVSFSGQVVSARECPVTPGQARHSHTGLTHKAVAPYLPDKTTPKETPHGPRPRPRYTKRFDRRRHGERPTRRGHRRQGRPNRRGRKGGGEGRGGDRRQGPYRDAGIRRYPYSLRCPGGVGRPAHPFVLAWCHDGGNGQLR